MGLQSIRTLIYLSGSGGNDFVVERLASQEITNHRIANDLNLPEVFLQLFDSALDTAWINRFGPDQLDASERLFANFALPIRKSWTLVIEWRPLSANGRRTHQE